MTNKITLGDIATKLTNPEEKFVQAIHSCIKGCSIESIDSLLDGFHDSISKLTDTIISNATLMIQDKNFKGYTPKEREFLKEEVYRRVIEFVREREGEMFRNGRYISPYCSPKHNLPEQE